MVDTSSNISVADILGAWVDPDWDSSLVVRCRKAWSKPLQDLSREELATFLRQKIAIEHILPIAKKRLTDGADDDTEMYDGELQEAIDYASGVIESTLVKMVNKVEINLENIDGGEELLRLFGEIFELGGPDGNVDCSVSAKKGWGMNWDALNDSLSYLDTGGIWGNSKKFRFPLQACIIHHKNFERKHPGDFKILIKILTNKVEQYKRHGMEFQFNLAE